MKSTRFSFLFNFTLTLVLLAAAAGLMFSQNAGQPAAGTQKDKQFDIKGFGKQKPPERPGSMETITVHGKSLEGNLEGDTPDREVRVYLPVSYTKNRSQRYPVLYFLHGYGVGAETYTNVMWASDAADKTAAAGTSKEMIVVFPDAKTIYDGSMYSNSPTTGDWETFISEDLVDYIDSHYRTFASRESRGLAGHSMGGYGTLRIAMKHPGIYAAIYPMSSCCLMDNPFATGRGSAPGAGKGDGKAFTPPPDAKAGDAKGKAGGGFANVGFAQAAAWAPNPKNPPQFFDMPTKDGQLVPAIAAKYVANSPLAMVDQYSSNLKKYKAFMMDCGLQDTLVGSNKELDESLTRLGIPHTYETYEGDHTNHVKDRWELNVLPFFSNNLSFTAPKKK